MDSWKPAGISDAGKTCGLRVGQHFMGDLLHSGFYDRGIDHGGNVGCVKVSG